MANFPTVGVIGCGSYGLTRALDYNRRTQQLIKVYAAANHRRIFDKARRQPDIEATEAMIGRYHADFEENLGKLCDFAEYILVSVPSNAHDDIVERHKPYREKLRGSKLVFTSGNGIAPIAHRALNPANTFESSRASYTCRAEELETGEVKCRMNGFKVRMVLASYLKADSTSIDALQHIFGMPVELYHDLLQLLMVNNHGVVHPPSLLRGRFAIERRAKMFTYRDLMGAPFVTMEILAADAQLKKLAEALGVEKRETVLETLNRDYGTEYPDLQTLVQDFQPLNKRPVLPSSMNSRMITQDIGILAVLYVSLGRALGVDMSVFEAWIKEASWINQTDYWKTGRTLKAYGLSETASREDIWKAFKCYEEKKKKTS
ncbi:Vitopine synthase [Morella rubra]|uniref:Vitopine synthase n=1 Tax=Morella rubra TaxID=262757 RepID=A0A6A1UU12_9ROSI|nr:Vitopine synthase [Morella rubra]